MFLILGHAILLDRSTDITSYIEHVKVDVNRAGGDVEETDFAEFVSRFKNLSTWECWLENGIVRMRDPEARKVEGDWRL